MQRTLKRHDSLRTLCSIGSASASLSLAWLVRDRRCTRIRFAPAITLFPLPIAYVILIWNNFKFSLKSLLWATSLVALFLFLSLMPLLRYSKTRDVGLRMVSAKAAINQGMEAGFDWNEFYTR